VDAYSWEEFGHEDEVIITLKIVEPLIKAIESTDTASLAFFSKIISNSSKVFIHKLLSNARVQPHIKKPIIQGAIRKRIDQLQSDLDVADIKDFKDYWQLLDAKIPDHEEINKFLQSNEKTFIYKNFISVTEARAFFTKYEETFKKLCISNGAGGRGGRRKFN
jgi:hypothetical protein